MTFDIKQTVRSYLLSFPGGFVAFLYVLADILDTTGKEWEDDGKAVWSNGLKKSAITIRTAAQDLAVVSAEFDKQQNEV